jgi:hypothetical protein
VLGSTKGHKKNQRLLWSGAPDCPVCHRTVSGTPEDFSSNSSPSEKSRDSALKFTGLSGVHRTVSGVPKKDAAQELASLGFSLQPLPYNSPDMSGVHRTVRCNLGATTTSRQRSPAGAFIARQKRAVVRHAGAGTPDTLQCMSGAPPDIKAGPGSELQRSNCNGYGDVAVASDMSGVHRTVRCTIRQTAPPTVKFGGWGYKYPNHPTIQGIQVFHLPTTIQELAFIAKHTKKRSNPLPTPHKALVTRESDL